LFAFTITMTRMFHLLYRQICNYDERGSEESTARHYIFDRKLSD
jgi:hypothetical protein